MITVKNDGDFGNHLFQYFFLRTHAEKNNLDWFFLDHWDNNPKYNNAYNNIFDYFDLPKGNISNPVNLSSLNKVKVPNKFIDLGVEDNILYEGYFQTDLYLKNNKENIKLWLKPKDNIIKSCEFIIRDIKNKLGCEINEIGVLHYRGTSYKNLNYDLPKYWFEEAKSMLGESVKKYIVFTDDVQTAQNMWGDEHLIISNNRILDFVTMFEFQNFIISPSSFSFWPAWISGKKVVAPKFWFGHNKQIWKPSIDIQVSDWLYL